MDKSNEIELLQAQLIQERALVQDLEAGKSKMILDAIEVGGQFSDLREAVRVLKEVLQFVMLKAPGYDWNTDPLSITLMVGNALTKSNHVLAGEPDEENDSLQAQLTQRTAEFQRHDGELQQICGQALGYPWFKDDQKSFPGATEKDGVCVGEHVGITIAQELANAYRKRTAELERVRADNKALDKWRADVTVSLQRPEGAFFVDVPQHIKDLMKERDELRTLIAALPKVEGQFEVGSGACYYVRALDGKSNPIVCGLMTEQAVAYAILALLKHRQGMEGYP